MIPWWAVKASPPRLVCEFRLVAPVTFDPDITTRTVSPAAGNPAASTIRRSYIPTGDPDIASPVPTMVASVPGPVAVRWWRRWNAFAGGRRWAYADDDLRVGNACCEEEATGDGDEDFLHRAISLWC
jgi:hypothetical protein